MTEPPVFSGRAQGSPSKLGRTHDLDDDQVFRKASISLAAGLVVYPVVVIVLSLVFWATYNHSIVTMSKIPGTNQARLNNIDFGQSVLFVMLLMMIKYV